MCVCQADVTKNRRLPTDSTPVRRVEKIRFLIPPRPVTVTMGPDATLLLALLACFVMVAARSL